MKTQFEDHRMTVTSGKTSIVIDFLSYKIIEFKNGIQISEIDFKENLTLSDLFKALESQTIKHLRKTIEYTESRIDEKNRKIGRLEYLLECQGNDKQFRNPINPNRTLKVKMHTKH